MHPGTETEPFRAVLHAEGTETLQITPKHHFGSNGGHQVRSRGKKFIRSSDAETVHSGTETPVLLRFSCSRSPNAPIHSQTLSEWIGSVRSEKPVPKFVTPRAVHPGNETGPFRFVLHAEGTETLHITPEHRFGSNGGYWVRSCENINLKFGGQNCAFGYRNTRFASIFVQ